MSNKLLIEKKQRNLLLNSEFMKRTEKDIFDLLQSHATISYKLAEEKNIVKKIKQNLPLWLDFSSKEWVPDKRNPRLNTEEKEPKRCQLCNTPIKFQYKIKNQENDNILLIGGNCVDNFRELKTMKKIVSTEDELQRYNKLLEYYPIAYDILMTNTDTIDNSKIILPKTYIDGFKKTEKKIIKSFRAFIKKNVPLKKTFLEKQIGIYEFELKLIKDFVTKNQNDKSYLTRDFSNYIKNRQPNDYPDILSTIQNNGGKMCPEVSIKIKIEEHLNEMKNQLDKKMNDDMIINSVRFGNYQTRIRRFNDNYFFNVDSEIILREFYLRGMKNTSDFYEKNLDKFVIADDDTYEKLVILGETFITANRNFSLKEIDYRKIIHRQDADDEKLSSTEYSSLYNSIDSIVQKYTIIVRQGDSKLLIYNNAVLCKFGKKFLFNQSEKDKEMLLNSYEQLMYIDEFYDFVLKKVG